MSDASGAPSEVFSQEDAGESSPTLNGLVNAIPEGAFVPLLTAMIARERKAAERQPLGVRAKEFAADLWCAWYGGIRHSGFVRGALTFFTRIVIFLFMPQRRKRIEAEEILNDSRSLRRQIAATWLNFAVRMFEEAGGRTCALNAEFLPMSATPRTMCDEFLKWVKQAELTYAPSLDPEDSYRAFQMFRECLRFHVDSFSEITLPTGLVLKKTDAGYLLESVIS